MALALVSAQANAAEPTVAELLERIQRIEARLGGEAPAPAPGTDPIAALDQRLRELERRLDQQAGAETARVAAETARAAAPTVTIDGRGLSVRDSGGDFELKIRGLVQADHRVFLDDDDAFGDGFLLRRVRPTFEGSLGRLIGWRITPELAGDSASLVDAYIDVRFDPRFTLRAGKVKGPIGLERLQAGSAISFVERGFPTELAPNRELGVQLMGEFAGGKVSYVAGIYNGAADGRDGSTTDPDHNREFAGRLFFEPWRGTDSALAGLGFGVAGSTGDKEGAGNAFLPRYRTPGQNVFFNYRGGVAADGRHSRFSPQGWYYKGPFGATFEAIHSRQELLLGGVSETLEHAAWGLNLGWVLTGEDASWRGVRPDRPFSAGADGWGAFELVGRFGELDIDDDAFPFFADPVLAATRARSWGIGLNWYLTSNLRFVVDHTRTRFDGGAVGGDRDDEKTLFTRLQVAF
ncbi:hypothetical protein P873_04650 [Arenimonas composti TR7-09 = DSM 18010]|uniref:Porin n=1 Tax=Arenimonas composti TR7-09 = DSM 18010 TaxID=1121013 RepID=A0A091BJM7_9GAMM|nr:hypothetical protein P873_04650 [Arenimonas composti TR7-09 = DSM 18010]